MGGGFGNEARIEATRRDVGRALEEPWPPASTPEDGPSKRQYDSANEATKRFKGTDLVQQVRQPASPQRLFSLLL